MSILIGEIPFLIIVLWWWKDISETDISYPEQKRTKWTEVTECNSLKQEIHTVK